MFLLLVRVSSIVGLRGWASRRIEVKFLWLSSLLGGVFELANALRLLRQQGGLGLPESSTLHTLGLVRVFEGLTTNRIPESPEHEILELATASTDNKHPYCHH